MPSWKKPTPEQIEIAITALAHPSQKRYFFEKLKNPEWIVPLEQKGFFKTAPEPRKDSSGNIIQYPPWPESEYLARVAAESPENVTNTLLKVDTRNNSSVIADIITAAAKIPCDFSVSLMKKHIDPWLTNCEQITFNDCDRILELLEHLIVGGEIKEAKKLFGSVFALLRGEKALSDTFIKAHPKPHAKLQTWEFEIHINKAIKSFCNNGHFDIFDILISLLNCALSLSEYEKPCDHSAIWRPAIEEHEQNIHTDITDVIITAIRDNAEEYIGSEPGFYENIISHLQRQDYYIFSRLALHLARKNPHRDTETVAHFLTNRTYFDSDHFRHEYGLLLNECFSFLGKEDQIKILAWISEGPIQNFEQYSGKSPADPKETDRYTKRWQLRKLALFHDKLPEEWKETYQTLVDEFGEPEHPGFAYYFKTTWGSKTPLSADELATMSNEELVDYLISWQPQDSFNGASKEGLADALQVLVSDKPEKYYDLLQNSDVLDPIYIWSILSGYRSAIKQNKAIDWDLLFVACFEIVSAITNKQKETNKKQDQEHTQVYMRIADIVDAFFEKSIDQELKYRDRVWQIIEPLTDNSDPTPESERNNAPHMDPMNLALNVVRGQALDLVINYALWIRRSFENLPDSKEAIQAGFNTMPEVRSILAKHLDIKYDPSLAVHSVYGQWFPWLVSIDTEWAKNHTDLVFPEDTEQKEFFLAAWYAYLSFSKAYRNAFQLLQEKYRRAIGLLSAPKVFETSLANPDEELTKHLMQLFWEGVLEGDLENDLFQLFWQKADQKLCAFAVQFVGVTLRKTEGAIEETILKRLTAFWAFRLEVNSDPAKKNIEELSNFCHWFSSEKFDIKWSLDMLLQGLELGAKMIPQMHAIERLTDLSAEFPQESINCLDRLIRNGLQPMLVSFWTKQIRTIISTAMNSGNSEIIEIAEKLVHYLGSRQFFDFRDLLNRDDKKTETTGVPNGDTTHPN